MNQRPASNVPLVAIVVCFNEEENIERTLKSVHGLCPIVVVDSGSTDRTLEICRQYADQFLTTRIRTMPSSGPGPLRIRRCRRHGYGSRRGF